MMLKKFSGLSSRSKKILSICLCVLVVGSMFAVNVFATDGTGTTEMSPVGAAQEIFATMTESISVGTIVSIIGVALAASIGIFLAWWAIRKVVTMVMTAFRKGKVQP